MSEDELYEVAKRRISQRNRRWTLWTLNLGVLILTLALVALIESPVTAALFLAWGGIFTIHTILLVMAQKQQQDIESEVAKLRQVADAYEKPKRESSRLELGEDGEINEIMDDPREVQRVKRN